MYDCMDVFLCRQQHPGATYFGKLTFATRKTKIEITPADVAVHDLKADSVVVRVEFSLLQLYCQYTKLKMIQMSSCLLLLGPSNRGLSV